MTRHFPVLQSEVLEFFDPKSNQHFIDCTIGNANHTLLFLESGCEITGLDRSLNSLSIAKSNTKRYKKIDIHHDNFTNFEKYLKSNTKGIFADLGLSTSQIKDDNLGLSFQDTTLDMRLDQTLTTRADDIINTYTQKELIYIFSKYAQETNAVTIAKAIVNSRPIHSALELSSLIENTIGRHHKTHPATKVFMALRIIINSEYQNLQTFLENTKNLDQGTKIGIITFHSGEDRIVKNFFKKNFLFYTSNPPILPSYTEIKENPASRSAIFRSCIKK